ncbi:MAG: hypothetical protein A2600_09995 [Candidatus Lambdaproteobacteria bacterium RIFOXYD1_FULL_56_27]|nr:MAG: hypothetical protein A2600_09995 [Candidatus Lambdaproteobacteria bacterium RIFOXYD1_FULL_56_27]
MTKVFCFARYLSHKQWKHLAQGQVVRELFSGHSRHLRIREVHQSQVYLWTDVGDPAFDKTFFKGDVIFVWIGLHGGAWALVLKWPVALVGHLP